MRRGTEVRTRSLLWLRFTEINEQTLDQRCHKRRSESPGGQGLVVAVVGVVVWSLDGLPAKQIVPVEPGGVSVNANGRLLSVCGPFDELDACRRCTPTTPTTPPPTLPVACRQTGMRSSPVCFQEEKNGRVCFCFSFLK